MSTHVKSSGTWQTVKGIWVKTSGTWTPLTKLSTKVSGVWQLAYQSLGATVNTTSAVGTDNAPGTPISNSVTCTASGGTAPYTYLWERFSGDTVTITSATDASTTFQFTNSFPTPDSKTGVYRCVVTDATSTVAYSPNVSVFLDSSP